MKKITNIDRELETLSCRVLEEFQNWASSEFDDYDEVAVSKTDELFSDSMADGIVPDFIVCPANEKEVKRLKALLARNNR